MKLRQAKKIMKNIRRNARMQMLFALDTMVEWTNLQS